MKAAALALMLLGLGLGAGPGAARADQKDPRLGPLFAELRTADAVEARAIEEQIWAIWGETSNPHARTLLEVGSVAMANRDHRTARAAFDALVALAPDFAEGWNKRATLFWLLGEDVASVRDIQRTLALEPRHFGALSGLGLILMGRGEDERALEAFEAALAIHPTLPGARQHAERLRREQGGAPL